MRVAEPLTNGPDAGGHALPAGRGATGHAGVVLGRRHGSASSGLAGPGRFRAGLPGAGGDGGQPPGPVGQSQAGPRLDAAARGSVPVGVGWLVTAGFQVTREAGARPGPGSAPMWRAAGGAGSASPEPAGSAPGPSLAFMRSPWCRVDGAAPGGSPGDARAGGGPVPAEGPVAGLVEHVLVQARGGGPAVAFGLAPAPGAGGAALGPGPLGRGLVPPGVPELAGQLMPELAGDVRCRRG